MVGIVGVGVGLPTLFYCSKFIVIVVYYENLKRP